MTDSPSPASPPSPPAHLDAATAAVWAELADTTTTALAASAEFEAYCSLVARLRQARKTIAETGLVVEDSRGRQIAHPAIEVERDTAAAIAAFETKFTPVPPATRRRGYMADATARSLKAAREKKLLTEVHDGPVAALRTIAWMIDEAQRSGVEELQQVALKAMPLYLRACAALQITPASVPAKLTVVPNNVVAGPGAPGPGRASARERRRGAG